MPDQGSWVVVRLCRSGTASERKRRGGEVKAMKMTGGLKASER